ncbi:MAG: hypothetical protein LBF60_05945 [Treponema sp.]|jgi:hypothetical protein|nr:hypothetical protein [Treponema sp.]
MEGRRHGMLFFSNNVDYAENPGKTRDLSLFQLVLEQAFGENCSFFMGLACAVYPIFSRGKKLVKGPRPNQVA